MSTVGEEDANDLFVLSLREVITHKEGRRATTAASLSVILKVAPITVIPVGVIHWTQLYCLCIPGHIIQLSRKP